MTRHSSLAVKTFKLQGDTAGSARPCSCSAIHVPPGTLLYRLNLPYTGANEAFYDPTKVEMKMAASYYGVEVCGRSAGLYVYWSGCDDNVHNEGGQRKGAAQPRAFTSHEFTSTPSHCPHPAPAAATRPAAAAQKRPGSGGEATPGRRAGSAVPTGPAAIAAGAVIAC